MENAWLSIRKLWKLKWQMARKLNCVDKYHISCDVFLRFFAAAIYCEVPHKEAAAVRVSVCVTILHVCCGLLE